MSAFGKFIAGPSDDARYVEGEQYDIVLNGDMTYNHYTLDVVPVVDPAPAADLGPEVEPEGTGAPVTAPPGT